MASLPLVNRFSFPTALLAAFAFTVGCSVETENPNGASGCATGQTLCGTACVDLASDSSHCGSCSVACGVGQACSAGTCTSGLDGVGGAPPGGLGGTGGVPGASGGASAGGNAGVGGSGSGGAPGMASTFQVVGRDLYDRCGEKVVLRGVNEMVVWSGGKDGDPEFAEIAKTGANAVRIVWTEDGTAAELDVAIAKALENELIPMIEHHSATGDLSKVPSVVDYWVKEDVNAVLKKYEADLLLNIANEAGATVTNQDFQDTYQTAITRLRNTGLVLPLIIDAPQWGQDIDTLQAVGPSLIAHDPESNLMFSVHMWWHDPTGTRVVDELQQSVEMGLPLVVGEFAQHAVYLCDESPFSYQTLLEEAQEHQIGWLAWSWGGVENGDCAGEGSFDMTVGGTYGNWEETWGEDVAVTHAASIKNTSVRPASITTGSCL